MPQKSSYGLYWSYVERGLVTISNGGHITWHDQSLCLSVGGNLLRRHYLRSNSSIPKETICILYWSYFERSLVTISDGGHVTWHGQSVYPNPQLQ